MKVYRNKKPFEISVKKVGFFGKILGLMFHTRKTQNLLFRFKNPTRISIHSYFVFFDFLAIWTNKDGKILEYKIVKPFTLTIKPQKKFSNLIEIPVNEKNKNLIKKLVGKDCNSIETPSTGKHLNR
jgi:uncharacterized membrane protein (UPF0127 family)